MQNTCKTCKYYKAHYVIRDAFGLCEVDGHCTKKIKNVEPKRDVLSCKNYETLHKSEVIKHKKKIARHVLESIEKRLEHVVLFLEN